MSQKGRNEDAILWFKTSGEFHANVKLTDDLRNLIKDDLKKADEKFKNSKKKMATKEQFYEMRKIFWELTSTKDCEGRELVYFLDLLSHTYEQAKAFIQFHKDYLNNTGDLLMTKKQLELLKKIMPVEEYKSISKLSTQRREASCLIKTYLGERKKDNIQAYKQKEYITQEELESIK